MLHADLAAQRAWSVPVAAVVRRAPVVAISDAVLGKEDFRFVGTVIALGSSNVPSLAGGDKSLDIVVRVTRVDAGRLVVGSSVTVRTPNAKRYKLRKDYVFAVRSWLYGESIAVVELGHDDYVPPKHAAVALLAGTVRDLDVPLKDTSLTVAYVNVSSTTGGSAVHSLEGRTIAVAMPSSAPLARGEQVILQTKRPFDAIVAASASIPSQLLLLATAMQRSDREKRTAAVVKNASDSAMVVSAQVVGVEPVADDRVAAHPLHLRAATLQVAAAYKGSPAQVVRVLYFEGDDIRWGGAPNLDRLRSGIYFLHPVAAAGLTPYAGIDLICFRAGDVLPASDRDLVAKALPGGQ
jgi:hypothetical protein